MLIFNKYLLVIGGGYIYIALHTPYFMQKQYHRIQDMFKINYFASLTEDSSTLQKQSMYLLN